MVSYADAVKAGVDSDNLHFPIVPITFGAANPPPPSESYEELSNRPNWNWTSASTPKKEKFEDPGDGGDVKSEDDALLSVKEPEEQVPHQPIAFGAVLNESGDLDESYEDMQVGQDSYGEEALVTADEDRQVDAGPTADASFVEDHDQTNFESSEILAERGDENVNASPETEGAGAEEVPNKVKLQEVPDEPNAEVEEEPNEVEPQEVTDELKGAEVEEEPNDVELQVTDEPNVEVEEETNEVELQEVTDEATGPSDSHKEPSGKGRNESDEAKWAGTRHRRIHDSALPEVAMMEERPVETELQEVVDKPNIPRANETVTKEHPDGAEESNGISRHGLAAEKPETRTVLQKHCDFFDFDGDGVIWPSDTYWGFYYLGYAPILCFVAVLVIHNSFSWPTTPFFPVPDPFFRVWINRVHKCKHGSDTGTYDTEGRFVPQRFEEMFSKYAKNQPDALSLWEFWKMISGNRLLFDFFGWLAAFLEWGATYLLIWPNDHMVPKESIRKMYDGTLFYEIAEKEKMAGRRKQRRWYKENKQVKSD